MRARPYVAAGEELAQHGSIRKMVAGEDVSLDVSMAKVFAGNLKQYVATTCQQMFGGSGYIWENPVGPRLCRTRGCRTIGGGADEVMKEVVAKILKI